MKFCIYCKTYFKHENTIFLVLIKRNLDFKDNFFPSFYELEKLFFFRLSIYAIEAKTNFFFTYLRVKDETIFLCHMKEMEMFQSQKEVNQIVENWFFKGVDKFSRIGFQCIYSRKCQTVLTTPCDLFSDVNVIDTWN